MTLIAAALSSVARGWRVHPVNGFENGHCTCPDGADCPQPGKHPILPAWQKKATSDVETIRAWWAKNPTANIGLATGRESGFFVVDIDGEIGAKSLAELQREHCEFPDTIQIRTGSGGLHFYFKFPKEIELRNKQSWRPGIDIRGEGGYVVGAQSHHRSGGSYECVNDTILADAPTWLLELLTAKATHEMPTFSPAVNTGKIFERAQKYIAAMEPSIQGQDGSGKAFAAALALVKGFSLGTSDAYAILSREFNLRCSPPWSEKELMHKISDANKANTASGYLVSSPFKQLTNFTPRPPVELPPTIEWGDYETTPAPAPTEGQTTIKASELESLLDDDIGAVMRQDIFTRLLATRKDRAEWFRIEDVMRRKKVKRSFDAAIKSEDRKPVHDAEWKSELLYRVNSKGDTVIENVMDNVVTYLKHDPAWKGVLALNLLSKRITAIKDPPFKFDRGNGAQWKDTDTLQVKMWFERNTQLRPNTNTVFEAIDTVSALNAFDPMIDYFKSLKKHEGESIIDTWIIDFFGAEDTPFNRAVGAKWLISAVARAHDPGCKVDTVLVLEGDQGLKKSRVLGQLCPDPTWFADGFSDIGTKSLSEDLEGKWIIEMAELDGIRKHDINKVKAFISRAVENYRPAYGRYSRSSPRRCVFAGTVNPGGSGYLTDETGNRRFWPVKCVKKAPELTAEMRDAMWAEARDRYRAGEKWHLEGDMEIHAKAATDERSVVDAWHDLVTAEIHEKNDTSFDELLGALGVEKKDRDQVKVKRVGRILRLAGWVKYQKVWPDKKRTWRFRRPSDDPCWLEPERLATVSEMFPVRSY